MAGYDEKIIIIALLLLLSISGRPLQPVINLLWLLPPLVVPPTAKARKRRVF